MTDGHERMSAAATASQFAAATGIVLAADLFTKRLAFEYLDPFHPLQVIPGLLDLRLSRNLGAVFGIGQGMGWLFILFTLAATAGILWAVTRYGRSSRLFTLALGLLLGGALGNLYDRLFLGGVRDFIDVYAGRHHWPTFNVADTAICIGAGLIVLYSFMSDAKRGEKAAGR